MNPLETLKAKAFNALNAFALCQNDDISLNNTLIDVLNEIIKMEKNNDVMDFKLSCLISFFLYDEIPNTTFSDKKINREICKTVKFLLKNNHRSLTLAWGRAYCIALWHRPRIKQINRELQRIYYILSDVFNKQSERDNLFLHSTAIKSYLYMFSSNVRIINHPEVEFIVNTCIEKTWDDLVLNENTISNFYIRTTIPKTVFNSLSNFDNLYKPFADKFSFII